MKNSNTIHERVNGESYDYRDDFMILSGEIKRGIVKTAENLLKQQQESNALLAAASRHEEKGFAAGRYSKEV